MDSIDSKVLFYLKLQSVAPLDKPVYCRYVSKNEQ